MCRHFNFLFDYMCDVYSIQAKFFSKPSESNTMQFILFKEFQTTVQLLYRILKTVEPRPFSIPNDLKRFDVDMYVLAFNILLLIRFFFTSNRLGSTVFITFLIMYNRFLFGVQPLLPSVYVCTPAFTISPVIHFIPHS